MPTAPRPAGHVLANPVGSTRLPVRACRGPLPLRAAGRNRRRAVPLPVPLRGPPLRVLRRWGFPSVRLLPCASRLPSVHRPASPPRSVTGLPCRKVRLPSAPQPSTEWLPSDHPPSSVPSNVLARDPTTDPGPERSVRGRPSQGRGPRGWATIPSVSAVLRRHVRRASAPARPRARPDRAACPPVRVGATEHPPAAAVRPEAAGHARTPA